VDERQEYERNNATYRRMKDSIAQKYPRGWFLGIADDQIAGDAATFADLERQLRAQGKDPRGVLVVEAGVDYPEYVTIFI
jgi:hypothetical protein